MTSRKAGAGIPVSVPAKRTVARREQFSGVVPLRQLKRLLPLLEDDRGELSVDLALSSDPAGAWMKGSIRGRLQLRCERGLHPFEWDCGVQVALLLVESEAQEEAAMEASDPYLVEDDQLPLWQVIEDEVLLALPMLPRCADEDCFKRLLK